jgi:hypothetical protein
MMNKINSSWLTELRMEVKEVGEMEVKEVGEMEVKEVGEMNMLNKIDST